MKTHPLRKPQWTTVCFETKKRACMLAPGVLQSAAHGTPRHGMWFWSGFKLLMPEPAPPVKNTPGGPCLFVRLRGSAAVGIQRARGLLWRTKKKRLFVSAFVLHGLFFAIHPCVCCLAVPGLALACVGSGLSDSVQIAMCCSAQVCVLETACAGSYPLSIVTAAGREDM